MTVVSERADPRRRASRKWLRWSLGSLVLVFVVLLITAAAIPFSLYRQIGNASVDLDALPNRPDASDIAGDAVNVAVLGAAHGQCVSAILFHIAADRQTSAFVSLPGLPACAEQQSELSAVRIQELAGQMEQQSGVHLDHLAVLDWNAVAELDGIARGVELDLHDLPENAGNEYPTVTAREVLDFVTKPVVTERDEEVRIRRQQVLLQKVLGTTLHQEMRKDPRDLYRFLDVVTENLDVDDDWSWTALSRLAISLRNLRSSAITYFTAPPIDLATDPLADPLWQAVREDRIDGR